MAQLSPYALTYDVDESVEARGLLSAGKTCLTFNVSLSMSLLKHFYKVPVS